jgi:hypothetical protein
MEPTLLASVESPMASVGLVSRLAVLPPLVPTVLKTHRAV